MSEPPLTPSYPRGRRRTHRRRGRRRALAVIFMVALVSIAVLGTMFWEIVASLER